MATNNRLSLEIERKWVLSSSPRAELSARGCPVSSIEQLYLPKLDGVRRRIRQEAVTYTLCAKRRLSPGVAEETEIALSATEFQLLRSGADGRRRAVRKTRFTLAPSDVTGPAGCRVREVIVDHILAPAKVWLVEVEVASLTDLDGDVTLAAWLGEATEVTHELGWTSAAIARRGVPALPAR